MKLLEISPFLRIALRYSLIQKSIDSYSLDNRLFYIRKGNGNIYINGQKHQIKPDTMFLWQRGTAYRFDFKDTNDVIVLNFDYTAEQSDIRTALPVIFNTKGNKKLIVDIKPIAFDDCAELNQPLILYNAQSLLPQLKELLADFSKPSVYGDSIRSAKLKMLIIEALKMPTTASACDDVNVKVQTVLDYIKENHAEELSNKKIASLVGYHPYYLNGLVKSVTGISLHQHLINYRILKAEALLVSTDNSVAEIAEKVGFSSAMVLIRNFRLKNKITPFEYRKQIRNMI